MKKLFFLLALSLTTVFSAQAKDEIYGVWDASATTLTIYFNGQKTANNGVNDWWMDENIQKATKVVFDASMKAALPTTTDGWFMNFTQLEEIQHLDYLNTSEVEDIQFMFYNCESLTSLDLSSFTTDKVINMEHLFCDCKALTSLDLSSFNTEKVVSMEYMFGYCEALTSLDLSMFKTPEVTNMNSMFSYCEALTSLDISSFTTDKVTDMAGMFNFCTSLTSLDLTRFNTSHVTDMGWMFADCRTLTSLDLSTFNTAKVTQTKYMFSNCEELTTIYCNDNLSERAGLDSKDMFRFCKKLVGGNGTTYDADHEDASYARPDKSGQLGYFTAKTQGLEQTSQEPRANSQKLIKDGQLHIKRAGKTYTATGAEYDAQH